MATVTRVFNNSELISFRNQIDAAFDAANQAKTAATQISIIITIFGMFLGPTIPALTAILAGIKIPDLEDYKRKILLVSGEVSYAIGATSAGCRWDAVKLQLEYTDTSISNITFKTPLNAYICGYRDRQTGAWQE